MCFDLFSNIITVTLPGFVSVQSAPAGTVDVQQGWLPKCYDPWERGPHCFYHLGRYIFVWECEESGIGLCASVIPMAISFPSLERIINRQAAAKSFCAPLPSRQCRWSALSDRQELTVRSKQWRYVWELKLSLKFCQILRNTNVLGNLTVLYVFSVWLLQLKPFWSRWFWWQESGRSHKGKYHWSDIIYGNVVQPMLDTCF